MLPNLKTNNRIISCSQVNQISFDFFSSDLNKVLFNFFI